MYDEQSVEDELTTLAVEGLESGDPFEPGPRYWETKHQTLNERLGSTNGR